MYQRLNLLKLTFPDIPLFIRSYDSCLYAWTKDSIEKMKHSCTCFWAFLRLIQLMHICKIITTRSNSVCCLSHHPTAPMFSHSTLDSLLQHAVCLLLPLTHSLTKSNTCFPALLLNDKASQAYTWHHCSYNSRNLISTCFSPKLWPKNSLKLAFIVFYADQRVRKKDYKSFSGCQLSLHDSFWYLMPKRHSSLYQKKDWTLIACHTTAEHNQFMLLQNQAAEGQSSGLCID